MTGVAAEAASTAIKPLQLITCPNPAAAGGATEASPSSGAALRGFLIGLALLVASLASAATTRAQADLFASILRLDSTIPENARTAATLGTSRSGSAIVLDGSGLALTIGYLILEADSATLTRADGREVAADLVAYDYDTGFGLVRAREPLDAPPIQLGSAQDLDAGTPIIIAAFGGEENARPGFVVDTREFAGYWEYVLDRAVFTWPPYPLFSGAALLTADGKLAALGSLQVSEAATRGGETVPGNMFVPIDLLAPIMGDLLSGGRAAGPHRPWLGVYVAEQDDRVVILRAAEEGPAASAGVRRGDIVMGVNGTLVRDLSTLFRSTWAAGSAGVDVKLQLLSENGPREVTVTTTDRYVWLHNLPDGQR